MGVWYREWNESFNGKGIAEGKCVPTRFPKWDGNIGAMNRERFPKNGIEAAIQSDGGRLCYISRVMGRIVTLFFLLVGSALAQVDRPEGRQLYVDVRQNKGFAPVDPVTPLYFQVKLEGQPVEVLAADRTTVWPRVAIVLDTSGSMSADRKLWARVFQLTEHIVRTLEGKAAVTLIASGHKLTKIVYDREGTLALMQTLQDLYDRKDKRIGYGRTQLWDTISIGANAAHLGMGDALIVISDGGENSSHLQQSDVEKQIRGRGIRLFGILSASMQPATPEEKMGPEAIKEITERTGGFSIPILRGKEQEMNAAIENVTSSITRPCLLRLDVPDKASGKLSVGYRGESGKFNEGLTVLAPKYIFPALKKDNSEPR